MKTVITRQLAVLLLFGAGLPTAVTACRPAPFIPADSNVIFRDDFEDAELADNWLFEGEDADKLSLTARTGVLRLWPQEWDPEAEDSTSSLLLIEASGDFVLLARMEFEPAADRQLGGLVIEGNDGRLVSFGVITADFPQGTFRGLSMVADRAGGAGPATAFESLEDGELHLRLARNGDSFAASYSRDGTVFFDVDNLTTDLSDTVRVGLGNIVRENCEARCSEPSAVDFDFFELGRLTESGGG